MSSLLLHSYLQLEKHFAAFFDVFKGHKRGDCLILHWYSCRAHKTAVGGRQIYIGAFSWCVSHGSWNHINSLPIKDLGTFRAVKTLRNIQSHTWILIWVGKKFLSEGGWRRKSGLVTEVLRFWGHSKCSGELKNILQKKWIAVADFEKTQ